MNRSDLLARVETVLDPPHLPLYLTAEEFDTIKPALRQVASYGHRIAIKAVDSDGYSYAAYQLGPRPDWEMADWDEDDQIAYEANLHRSGYEAAAKDMMRLLEAAKERGVDPRESLLGKFMQDALARQGARVEMLRKRCRSRREKESCP